MGTIRKHFVGNIYPTNCDGDVVILENDGKSAKVKFLNTGFETQVLVTNLMVGKCRDYTITNRVYTDKEYPNVVMQSNNSGSFNLLEKQGSKCLVQFIGTGYTTTCLWENIKLGKIKDPYFKSCYSVGYTGEFEKTSYWKQAKQLWRNMLKRCYCEKDTRGYYSKGVSVDDRWLCFANFLEDLPKLENFELWLQAFDGNIEKYNLDKDYLIKGNKIYSRGACMFLPESLNKSLGSRNKWVSSNE